MIEFIDGKFVHARYASGRKDMIVATYQDNEGQNYPITIRTDLEDEYYLRLLDTYSIDEISRMTTQFLEGQRQAFEAMVLRLGQDFGLLYDPNVIAEERGDTNVTSIEQIFEPGNDTKDQDFLFNLKLRIFDMEEVENSDNAELKKSLREAQSPLESLYIAGKFLYE